MYITPTNLVLLDLIILAALHEDCNYGATDGCGNNETPLRLDLGTR
jgi:hypothetical protein